MRSFEIRIEFDYKVTCRFENFESAACHHTTNYALTHCSTKTSTFAPFVVEIYVYNSTLRVAVGLILLLRHVDLQYRQKTEHLQGRMQ